MLICLVMVYVYLNKMMVVMQFLLSLVTPKDMGDEVEGDQVN